MKNDRPAVTTARALRPGPAHGACLNTPAAFQALLRHERNRADREGSEFALAVFDLASLGSRGPGVRRLTDRICGKMRSIDEIGWIDSRRIGVLLPVTNLDGGRKFLRRAGESIPGTVYAYPGHWLPINDGEDAGTVSAAPADADALRAALSRTVPVWKSGLDIVGSLVILVLLSPVFLLMAMYVKAVSPGKVFYLQKRVGHRGRVFTFIKFRTMHQNNDPVGHREHLKQLIRSGRPMEKLDAGRDPRIIPGGRLIRKLCLDELPQLFNVLRRDMSLVGPRPCIPYEAEEYLRWHAHRFDTLPGMTGLWQVSGKNKLSFEQMVRLDIAYGNRMSLLRDLKILLLTVPAIIRMVFEARVERNAARMMGQAVVGMVEGDKEGSLRDA